MSHSAPDHRALENEIARLRQEIAALQDRPAQPAPTPSPGWGTTIFHAVYDQAPHLAGVLDPAGRLQHANRVACALIGQPPAAVVGQFFWETPWWSHAPAEQQKLHAAVARAALGESVLFETNHRSSDDSLHPVDFSVRPAFDPTGQVVALIVEGWDTTGRRQTEEALERTRLLLDAVLDQSPVPMIAVSAPDHIVRYVNRAAVQTLGVTDEPSYQNLTLSAAVERRTWQDLQLDETPVAAEDLPLVRALRGETTRNVEHVLVRKDGTRAWVQAAGTPIVNREGTLMAGVVAFRDVSEQRQSLEQNRQMANEQRAILNTVTTGLCLLKDRRVQWVNPAFTAMFGYSPAEVHGAEMRQFYADTDSFERVGREGYARLTQGEGYAGEALYQRRDGTPFWCSISGRAIDPLHLEVGSIWALHDITARRQAEEALRLSEARLESAQAQARIGSWEFDPATRTIVWTKELFRLLGRDPRLGPPPPEDLLELVHPDDRGRLREANQRAALSSASCTCEYRSNPAHGPVRHFSSILQPARDAAGQLLRIDGTLQEITDRKRAEAAAHEGEKRFQRLLENSNDIIAVIDARGTYLAISGPIKAILGYVPEELVGRNGFELLHPEDSSTTVRALARALDAPGNTHRVENRYRHKLGHWVALEVVGTNWLHDPGIRGVVLNIREITARKHAELERATLQEQLQQAMKMEAVGRLAGGVAHDFNNLLTVITGNVELACCDLSPADPLYQYLAEVTKAAESAASLTRQLLAFSRRQLIEPKILSLSELVENLRKMLHRLIGEDIELRTALAADLGSVKADPGQFDQVVVNLAVNARDAMPDGGRLTITTANVELDEAYCQRHPDMKPGSYVLLSVGDTGHGMPPEVQRRLFEPFFTTKPKGRGTGLGLAVIFGVVKQAGGTIEVDSAPGRGTTFKIHLPRLCEPAEKLARASASADLPRGHEAILLVEDEQSVRELAASILKRQGYKVLAAANGGEALLLAERRAEPIHLLLTDVVMPGMNGRELSERLLAIRPDLAVLFASGYTEDTIVHHGVLAENLHFIAKPYTLQAIAQKVRQVLDDHPKLPGTAPGKD